MKTFTRTAVLISIIGVFAFLTGCEVCAKCTEPSTGITDEYCGKKVSAESYARTLRLQGWTCKVD